MFDSNESVKSASSVNPASLSEDVMKLNINEFKNSSAKDDSSFVFRSSKMVSASSKGSSDTSFPEQNAAGGSDGDKFESSDKNGSCDTASTSIGISSSGLFTFQAGCAKTSFEGQLSQDQVNDDTQLNGAAAQISFSSGGFDSQVNNVVSEATAMAGVGKENNKSSSTNTLGGLGMPFTDFKAALKHHPDKASQFLSRSESGDDGQLWKEIVQEVHADADRLFKMIGEAYAVLSDPSKRSEYDLDEEIRKESKENNGSSHRTYTRSNSNERNDYHQHWQDNWKTNGYSRSRWYEKRWQEKICDVSGSKANCIFRSRSGQVSLRDEVWRMDHQD